MASHRSAGIDGGRVMPEDGPGRLIQSRRTRRGVNGYEIDVTAGSDRCLVAEESDAGPSRGVYHVSTPYLEVRPP